MYEEEENRWRCSFRSDGKWINVNELLQAFCGGGHAAAAGVRKRTNDVEKFRQEILERIVMMRKISGQNKELETKHRRTRRCRMMEKERTYIAIDLKSFYASVECKERNRDPLTTNLVVADKSRTEKTICLAVSPALKYYGIPGRARLFEVVQKVKEANSARRWKAP
uniref:DHHA1 domain-containing protein n=1 Tax=Anaerobutyricum hallii TaxID=39488 RepID=UPI003A872B9C